MVLEEEKGDGMSTRLALFLVLMMSAPFSVLADSSALILSSVPGSPQHEERFKGWTDNTRKVLIEKFGFSEDRVVVLTGRTTAEDIRKTFAQLKGQLKPADAFFLFFIGHGSFAEDYKFNISGPDLTAADYSRLLSTLAVGKTVIINATSASGGSIEAFAGKNRVVVTATRSGGEGNETIFYGHFLEALQNAEADEDKDQKTSVWEAFKYANAAVLLNERVALEQKIEALRLNRGSVAEPEYETQMEALLIELALKNQQIREEERK
jgi:hypothetical protein